MPRLPEQSAPARKKVSFENHQWNYVTMLFQLVKTNCGPDRDLNLTSEQLSQQWQPVRRRWAWESIPEKHRMTEKQNQPSTKSMEGLVRVSKRRWTISDLLSSLIFPITLLLSILLSNCHHPVGMMLPSLSAPEKVSILRAMLPLWPEIQRVA